MRRRSFLASLFALPFLGKPLEALTPKPRKLSPEEMRVFIERKVAAEMGRIYDRNYRAVMRNSEALRKNWEAIRFNAPTGFKKLPEKE